MDLIVKNGTIVTASGISRADLGVKGGKIVQIGGELGEAGRTIDASGCYVMPGGVDVHTHIDSSNMETKSADDFRGGTLADAIAKWDSRAEGRAAIDYGYHVIVLDMNDGVFEELLTLPERGIPSFKVFMAYRGMNMIDDVTLLKTLEQAKQSGALVMVHAENGDAADFLRDKFVAEGKTSPKYHALRRRRGRSPWPRSSAPRSTSSISPARRRWTN
jgi:dihydropyrimidinase